MLRILVLFLLLGIQAQAGPWPRGKGKLFYSAHANGEYSEDTGQISQFGSLYGEYGLSDTFTLGTDYSGSDIRTDKAIAFLRVPIANKDRPWLLAAEIGIGLVDSETTIRPGFSIGRGYWLWDRDGWMTLDTRALLIGGTGTNRIEADFTIGLNVSKRIKAILQLQGGMPSTGSDYLKFAPSVVFERKQRKRHKSRRKSKRFIEIGVTTGILNYDAYAAKVGIWREF